MNNQRQEKTKKMTKGESITMYSIFVGSLVFLQIALFSMN